MKYGQFIFLKKSLSIPLPYSLSFVNIYHEEQLFIVREGKILPPIGKADGLVKRSGAAIDVEAVHVDGGVRLHLRHGERHELLADPPAKIRGIDVELGNMVLGGVKADDPPRFPLFVVTEHDVPLALLRANDGFHTFGRMGVQLDFAHDAVMRKAPRRGKRLARPLDVVVGYTFYHIL